jgi:hypothetical protein
MESGGPNGLTKSSVREHLAVQAYVQVHIYLILRDEDVGLPMSHLHAEHDDGDVQ